MRRTTTIILLGAFVALLCLAKTKEVVYVRAVRHASQVNERTYTYTTPGTANTSCVGGGTGTTVGGTTTVNTTANCQTTSTPAQTHQNTLTTVDVSNVVELMFDQNRSSGMQYTIVCRATWVGSNCTTLVEGEIFPAEIKGTTMWISERKGGNQAKVVRAKHKILDIRPLVR